MSRVDPMPNKCKVLLMSMCKRFRWTVGVLRVDTDLDGPRNPTMDGPGVYSFWRSTGADIEINV